MSTALCVLINNFTCSFQYVPTYDDDDNYKVVNILKYIKKQINITKCITNLLVVAKIKSNFQPKNLFCFYLQLINLLSGHLCMNFTVLTFKIKAK